MKYILAFICCIVGSSLVYGQSLYSGNYTLNFEDTSVLKQVLIDTNSQSKNIWQIGPPQKSKFDSAKSFPNVIVTDTINPYPTNNFSSFIVLNAADYGYSLPHTATLTGYYYVDTDSLNDFGVIEFSPDNGIKWVDLLNDTIYNAYYSWWNKPILSGNSKGWKYFGVDLANLGNHLGVKLDDTVQYRFSFISDGIADTLSGLMYDDFRFSDFAEGVHEVGYTAFNSFIYPNPSDQIANFKFHNPNHSTFELELYDITGKIILKKRFVNSTLISINTINFKSGIYQYKLINRKLKMYSVGKLIVNDR